MSETDKTFDSLMDLTLQEQILQSCSKEMIVFLRERKFQSVEELTEAGERYRVIHPGKSVARKTVGNLWSISGSASANEFLANVSLRHSNFYRGNSRGNRRSSSYSSASRSANRDGYQRSSYVSSGGLQEQSSSRQDQQCQFQYVRVVSLPVGGTIIVVRESAVFTLIRVVDIEEFLFILMSAGPVWCQKLAEELSFASCCSDTSLFRVKD